jgi:hypothetical protein
MMLDQVDRIVAFAPAMVDIYKWSKKCHFFDIPGEQLHHAEDDSRFSGSGFRARHVQFICHVYYSDPVSLQGCNNLPILGCAQLNAQNYYKMPARYEQGGTKIDDYTRSRRKLPVNTDLPGKGPSGPSPGPFSLRY